MVYVCTQPDLWTAQLIERQTVWTAILSNGETIYQDDEREGVEPESAWLRLGMYCRENNIHIVSFTLQNGTNTVRLDEGEDGYFFCKGANGYLFTSNQETFQSYIVGTLNGDILRVTNYNIPELIAQYSENRDPDEAGDCLIRKQGVCSDEREN